MKVLTGDNDLVTRKVCSEVGIHAEKILLGSAGRKDVGRATCRGSGDDGRFCAPFARAQEAHREGAPAQKATSSVSWVTASTTRRRSRRRRGHLGGQRGGHRQGIRRHDFAGEEFDGAGGRRAGRPQGLREHSEIHSDGREFQFRQHVQRDRRQRVACRFVPMRRFRFCRTTCFTTFRRCRFRRTTSARQTIAKPRPWHMGEISRFIVCIGPISSIFDYTTYAMMWFIFKMQPA